jgi:putative endonuclease
MRPRRTAIRQAITMKHFYVYMLQGERDAKSFYSGFTEGLLERLNKHDVGEPPHRAKLRPWRMKTAIAFTEHERAVNFERYLKSSSGRAFAKKRL